MVDILTITREGRLAVLEWKADEDIHLALQGLDYWTRVEWHRARNEFLKFGYFGDRELSSHTPLLFFVAPAFHVHPQPTRFCVSSPRRLIAPSSASASTGAKES